MAGIKYILSTKAVAGKSELYLRLYVGRGRDYKAKCGIFVPIDKWDAARNELVFSKRMMTDEVRAYMRTQERINSLSAAVLEAYMANPSSASVSWLKTQILLFHNPDALKPDARTLASYIPQYCASVNLAPSTRAQYGVLARMLEAFGEAYEPITTDNLSKDMLDRFVAYIREEHPVKKYKRELEGRDKRDQNTISSKLKRLRAVCNYLRRRDILHTDPFADYDIPAERYAPPEFLTIEERDRIASFEGLSDALKVQRDIFIFQCHVGCRVSDLRAFTTANIDTDGRTLIYQPRKTEEENPEPVRVPLDNAALAILERLNPGLRRHRLLPCIADTHYCDAIREVMRRAGVDRVVMAKNPVTHRYEPMPICDAAASHLARKTFAANLFEACGSAQVVASMAGWSRHSRAMDRYTKVTEAMKQRVIEAVQKKSEEKAKAEE